MRLRGPRTQPHRNLARVVGTSLGQADAAPLRLFFSTLVTGEVRGEVRLSPTASTQVVN